MDIEIEQFFKTLGINPEKKNFYRFWKPSKGSPQRYLVQSQKSLTRIGCYKVKRWQTNCWFFVNAGIVSRVKKTIPARGSRFPYTYTKIEESRLSRNVQRFNAFYFDFDVKGADGGHLVGRDLLDAKAKLYTDLAELPVTPTAIVETRNGYQVYFAIADTDRSIPLEHWERCERGMLKYIQANVTDCIDPAVTDASRILRVPGTYHQKLGDDDLVQVELKVFNDAKYTVAKLEAAFEVVNYQNTLRKSFPKVKTASAKRDPRLDVGNLRAIKNLDADHFAGVVQRRGGVAVDYRQALSTFRRFDLFRFLGITGVAQNQNFNSILYEDHSPSCVIFRGQRGCFYYYTNSSCEALDIVELCQCIANVDRDTAVKFLCRCFGLNLVTASNTVIDEWIELQLRVYDDWTDVCGVLKTCRRTYVDALAVLKRNCIKFDVTSPELWQTMLTAEYVAGVSGSRPRTVADHLKKLENVGVLERQRYDQLLSDNLRRRLAGRDGDVKVPNIYRFTDLSERAVEFSKKLDEYATRRGA